MSRLLRVTIRHLFPGYFALVMATGIVSIGAFLLGMQAVAWVLFGINLVAYPCLCLLNLARLAFHSDKVLRDLTNYGRGPGFLTCVAASCILGSQFFLFLKSPAVGLAFWLLSLALWLTIIYTLFTVTITNPHKPDTRHALHGGWLIPVVATQSLALLGALLAPEFSNWTASILFVALCMFLLGSMLYTVTITLIFHRLVFSPMTPEDLTPPYWIDMGAVAITTLAGSTLAMAAPSWNFLQQILPFLLGFSLMFWATATWWIPLLMALSVWRYWFKRYPLRYDPRYWDIVFPLGMYPTCTLQLARAARLRLEAISEWLIYLALAAWLAGFLGLSWRTARCLFSNRPLHRVGYHRTRRVSPGG